MNRNEKGFSTRKSRRDFAKIVGVSIAGSALRRGSALAASTDEADIEALERIAIEGTAVRLTAAELADLTKDIQQGRKSLARIRNFNLSADVEPTFIFRAGSSHPSARGENSRSKMRNSDRRSKPTGNEKWP